MVEISKEEEKELQDQLARLQQEHRDLDAAISALQHSPGSDQLQVQRLKKRKLALKDRIATQIAVVPTLGGSSRLEGPGCARCGSNGEGDDS